MQASNSDLLVGANYHPHDWNEGRWETDLNLMKAASFNVIRLGHLCWDSFEAEDGLFTFDWMEKVMDLCAARNIRVFLDIPTRPAPTWLHKKHPSVDIVDRNGIRQNAHSRYMEDVGDPNFQFYALRLVREMARRFGKHPALYAFGICNELGSGFRSYSESARMRFAAWLKEKYVTTENLNRAWASQRWSRKVSAFDEIDLPIGSVVTGAPERYLDMARFYSDEIINYMKQFRNILREEAPDVIVSGNHWAEHPGVGFDYLKSYRLITDISAQGFYPGTNPESEDGIIGACFCVDHRMAELTAPNWNLEFQTGGYGAYSCPKGAMRMLAYIAYSLCGQMICAWTWRTMLAGEEQFLFGLLDHDGEPSHKFTEFKQIAEEAARLNGLGLFARKKQAEYAIAYSYECMTASNIHRDYYTTPYTNHVTDVYKVFYRANTDVNIIDLRKIEKNYKAVIIPGHCVMDEQMAESVKELLKNGCHVIMSAFSAKVNENGIAFDTALPGYLSDVFGIKIRGFGRARTHVSSVNFGGLAKPDHDEERDKVELIFNGQLLDTEVNYHEFLKPVTAKALANYRNSEFDEYAAVSINEYAAGKAVYMGIPADAKLLTAVLKLLTGEDFISKYPPGIISRDLNGKGRLFVNTTGNEVSFPESGKGLLLRENYTDSVTLPAYGVEVIER
ncbi:MAG: beta-galactosidase [Clostridiales bacterium]|nr:beta-galactosidase [Clostridiales bacterium]